MTDPIHPTYGTLDNLLTTIRSDIRSGYDLRIGLEGALHWFSREYAKQRGDGTDAAGMPSSSEGK